MPDRTTEWEPSATGDGPGPESGGNLFPPTRSSLIEALGADDESERFRALSELCQIYWYPVYAYARKRGYAAPEAEDFTQELFRRMLVSGRFAALDHGRGRVRSYLLTSVSRLFAEDWRKRMTDKRDPGQPVVSIDAELAERRYHNEPRTDESPETFFDKRWALTLLSDVESRLEEGYAERGKSDVFRALKPFISGKPRGEGATYADVARVLGTTEGNVKILIHRMRGQFRELVKSKIAETLTDAADIDDELKHLYAVLGGR